MSKKSLKRFARFVVFTFVLGALALAAGYYSFYGKALDGEMVVRIGKRSSYDEIVDQIYPNLRTPLHRLAFDFYAKRLDLERRCQVGNFSFGGDMNVIRIVRKIVLGEQIPVKLVIGSARTLPQLAKNLSRQIDADTTSLLATMRDDTLRAELGFVKDSTIAMFIPNTYEVYWTMSADQLFTRMYKEYQRFWNEERMAKARKLGMTPVEVATLASIIASETNKKDEYPIIASLYLNRLRKGIALQACPTVIYAVGDFSLRRVLKRHLAIDSPYNTYKNRGLPPGPIRLARPDVIDAVLNAPKTDYLYMCANPDFSGTHVFSSTYAKHSATARQYQSELNKRKVK